MLKTQDIFSISGSKNMLTFVLPMEAHQIAAKFGKPVSCRGSNVFKVTTSNETVKTHGYKTRRVITIHTGEYETAGDLQVSAVQVYNSLNRKLAANFSQNGM